MAPWASRACIVAHAYAARAAGRVRARTVARIGAAAAPAHDLDAGHVALGAEARRALRLAPAVHVDDGGNIRINF